MKTIKMTFISFIHLFNGCLSTINENLAICIMPSLKKVFLSFGVTFKTSQIIFLSVPNGLQNMG